MRKLMWFALGFAAACGLWAYGAAGKLCLAAAGVLALLGCLLSARFSLYRRPALVFLGCTLGLCWCLAFRSGYLTELAAMDARTETVTIRTSDFGVRTDYGVSVDGRLALGGKTCAVRVYLKDDVLPEPGQLITGPFRFSLTAPAEDPVSYLSGEGIFLIARQTEEVTVRPDGQITMLDRVARLRHWLRLALKESFPEDAHSFAQALLLGDTSAIDYETDTAFKLSGIRHVIAVSGLHVSILVALLSAVTFRKRILTVPAGLCLLTLFAALAGFSPSVSRACLMAGLMLLAMLFEREYDGPTALAFAVLVMVVWNPLVISSVSFQLSVASVAGIYLFDPRVRRWLLACIPEPMGAKWKEHLRKGFCGSVSLSLSAMVLTVPLCAWYFGMVSLVGVVTNLLVLWIISGIFYGIMAVCLLYAVWSGGAVLLAGLVAWPIRYVLAVARFMADLPLAAVYTRSIYIVLWLVFVYILLAVFLLDPRRSVRQLFCCGLLGLCVALLASWDCPQEDGRTTLTVLDVGQGQCILIRSEGRTFMIDCGGDVDSRTADLAAAQLLSQGIDRLDGLILTHLDRDHAGAVEAFMTRIRTELLILPAEYSTLSAESTIYASEDLQLQMGEGSLRVFAPTFPGTGNEKSLCVLFESENCDILITGDRDGFGERSLLRNAHIPEVDVLIAGHHGSQYSTCEELLAAVSPEIVCISAGKNNLFGHPAPELLDRLEAFGCTVYRTDLHGTITIRR